MKKKINLSININKFATLRNARGENTPNIIHVIKDIQEFGADGITIHPRPDERHITFKDTIAIKKYITTEYNIEGYPNARFMDILKNTLPEQITLVPDKDNVLTSNQGWDTFKDFDFLKSVIKKINSIYIQKKSSTIPRISIFLNPEKRHIDNILKLKANCIELFTDEYAKIFVSNKKQAIQSYKEIAEYAHHMGIKINAGHNLNLDNVEYFCKNIPFLQEVSIGHAIICDALYLGLEETISRYKKCLEINK